MYKQIQKDLNKMKNPEKIEVFKWFFKTGKGQYGEGDEFLGLTSAQTKDVAKKYYKQVSLEDVQQLLNSKIHEHRMCGVRTLVFKYDQTVKESRRDPSATLRSAQDDIFNFYIKNAKRINNWDLVDVSAPNIVGQYILRTPFRGDPDTLPKGSKKPKDILYKFAISKNLWERRIAIISTFTFIRSGDFKDTIKISEILLKDSHDLIHKAVGWMLREMGKRDVGELKKFLDKYIAKMPRTMLRYAIERLPERTRKYYLNKK